MHTWLPLYFVEFSTQHTHCTASRSSNTLQRQSYIILFPFNWLGIIISISPHSQQHPCLLNTPTCIHWQHLPTLPVTPLSLQYSNWHLLTSSLPAWSHAHDASAMWQEAMPHNLHTPIHFNPRESTFHTWIRSIRFDPLLENCVHSADRPLESTFHTWIRSIRFDPLLENCVHSADRIDPDSIHIKTLVQTVL